MLNENETKEIIKKEVPALLHKRIAELELALGSAIKIGKFIPTTKRHFEKVLNKEII